ncbi:MAG: DEAD/DEAH box helicase, partial [Deltaproteobacteria bacterium]|nr:DEAD/DEAH box helicase [Deltaproteobacteria bacterium]
MSTPILNFAELGLSSPLLANLKKIGYQSPSPIQAKSIPYLLKGQDLVGQAQTGTGKTAAFALPLLSRLNFEQREPSILVLTPTRELAIQVAKAFQVYGSSLKKLKALPVYGGASMREQIQQLKKGVDIVVGTPGRLMDHLRRGTLQLDKIKALVLDEADEMLRMGFLEDVQWILDHTPNNRQTALFSATMPQAIRNIAQKHLKNPKEITIKKESLTSSQIKQSYCFAKRRK